MRSSKATLGSRTKVYRRYVFIAALAAITLPGCQGWWKPGKSKSLIGFVREQPEEPLEVPPPSSNPSAKRVVLPRDRNKQGSEVASDPVVNGKPNSNHLTRSELASMPSPKESAPEPTTATSAEPKLQTTPSSQITPQTVEQHVPQSALPPTTPVAAQSPSQTSQKSADVIPSSTDSQSHKLESSAIKEPVAATEAKSNTAIASRTPDEVDIEEALSLLPAAYQAKMRQAITKGPNDSDTLNGDAPQKESTAQSNTAQSNTAQSNTEPRSEVIPASFRDAKDLSNDPNRWTEDLNRTIHSLEQRIQNASSLDPSLRTHLEMNLRLLYLTQRNLEQAKRPVSGLTQREQSFLDHQLTAWYQTTTPDPTPSRPRYWSQVMAEQQLANHHLAALGALQINCIEFCTQVDGYGAISKFQKNVFQPDQELLLYCELDNVTSEAVRNGFETKVKGTYEIRDSQGKRLLEQALPMEPDVCEHRRRDHFLVYKIFTPATIENGKYELQLTMEDLHGNKFAVSKSEFEIRR